MGGLFGSSSISDPLGVTTSKIADPLGVTKKVNSAIDGVADPAELRKKKAADPLGVTNFGEQKQSAGAGLLSGTNG